jgi:hypothetical protein
MASQQPVSNDMPSFDESKNVSDDVRGTLPKLIFGSSINANPLHQSWATIL